MTTVRDRGRHSSVRGHRAATRAQRPSRDHRHAHRLRGDDRVARAWLSPDWQSFKKLVESAAGRAWIQSGASLRRYLRTTRETFTPLTRPWAEDAYRVALEADAVIAHSFTTGGALSAAEKKGMPGLIAAMPPFAASGELEPVFYPQAPEWRWLRRWLGAMSFRSVGALMCPELDAFRKSEGLPPLTSSDSFADAVARGTPLLHLFSKELSRVPPIGPTPCTSRASAFSTSLRSRLPTTSSTS